MEEARELLEKTLLEITARADAPVAR